MVCDKETGERERDREREREREGGRDRERKERERERERKRDRVGISAHSTLIPKVLSSPHHKQCEKRKKRY